MKRFKIMNYLLVIIISMCLMNCEKGEVTYSVLSPQKNIEVVFSMNEGVPQYSVKKGDLVIISPSALGFEIKDKAEIFSHYKVSKVERTSFDETWTPVWGENSSIRNNYNGIKVSLNSLQNKEYGLNLFFKVYDDGIGFRYELLGKEGDSLFVNDENSEFNLVGDFTAWWIPQDFDSYERSYETTDYAGVTAVNTPVTFKSKENGYYLSIHEANLTNYAGMTLEKSTKGLKSVLVPWPDGIKVKATYPMLSPWRTIQISEKAGGLMESNLIVNLNEPNKLEDTSWITTGKYIGIWWGMHLNINTWHAGPNHGATTENAKRLIDFAAKHDISGLLMEGWNIGWEGFGSKVTIQNYTTPYDDMDYPAVVEYGKSKGVNIIGHHETAAHVLNYISQMDDAYAYFEKLGIHAVKTGYVGQIIPKGQHHHGQWMVNHYRDVVKLAAKHKVMIDAHEPIKPTGIRRTYPNMMTREGAKGMEYNAWSDGNPPEHTLILPFTRFLGGPMDYTPGIFDIKFDQYKKNNRVYTTLAKQLAYYVTLYSPWQMAADLIENYEANPDAFEFIDAVYTNWDETKVLDAEIGDYLIMVRRKADEWFLGATTDELQRDFEVKLDFLNADKKYVAHIFADAMTTNWETDPTEIEIGKYVVTSKDMIHCVLSPAGGQAIHFEEYKAGNYPEISKFNDTAEKRIELYKKVPIFNR